MVVYSSDSGVLDVIEAVFFCGGEICDDFVAGVDVFDGDFAGDVGVVHQDLTQGRLLGLKEQWREHR